MDEPELLLLNCIEKMKKKMVETAQNNGMHSKETIQCSQNLDILINKHISIERINV